MNSSTAHENVVGMDLACAGIAFDGVVRRYAPNHGLGPVTFSAKKGTICSIIGPNGSGKTTLIRAAALFEQPDAGRIYVDGQMKFPAAESPDQIRGRLLGTVFQHAELWPHLNVRENITLPLTKALGYSDAKAKDIAEKELDGFGLADRALAMPGQLSGGMRQRAVLARCFAAPVQILLLDEITSALDPDWTEIVRQRLRAFADMGGTVISVSHRLNLVRRMSDSVIYLEGGLIVEQGTPRKSLTTRNILA